MGIGRAFHKAGPDIEKTIDPVFKLFIRGRTNLFEFVERRYFDISTEQVSQPNMQVDCLIWIGRLLCIS